MRKQKCSLVIIILILVSSCTKELLSTTESNGSTENETIFREKMLDEINFVRTTPLKYADTRLIDQYNSQTDNGAYLDLSDQEELTPLVLNLKLTLAADKYAQFLAINNLFGHTEDRTPSERCKREGYENYSGENIAAGSYSYFDIESDPEAAAIQFMIMWIIDEGVEGVGHRKNILSSYHESVGIGFHNDLKSTYVNYSVQDFGSEE